MVIGTTLNLIQRLEQKEKVQLKYGDQSKPMKIKKTRIKYFKNSLLKSFSAADDEDVDTKNSLYVTIVNKKFKKGKK